MIVLEHSAVVDLKEGSLNIKWHHDFSRALFHNIHSLFAKKVLMLLATPTRVGLRLCVCVCLSFCAYACA